MEKKLQFSFTFKRLSQNLLPNFFHVSAFVIFIQIATKSILSNDFKIEFPQTLFKNSHNLLVVVQKYKLNILANYTPTKISLYPKLFTLN